MKKVFLASFLALILTSCGYAQKQKSYVIGFYNLENLFDIYDDPAKNDEEFLPEGANNWTEKKYNTKLYNMAHVIRAMKDDNGVFHTILGVSEIENRLVLEDLVSQPEIADADYQIVHYDSPDRRGVDCALLYRPSQFKLISSEAIPYTFKDTKVDITLNKESQDRFRTRDVIMAYGKIEDEEFAFYVAHLPSRRGGKGYDLRQRGAEIIYNHASMMMEKHPGIKIVVMGDMNDDPTDESMAKYLHGKENIKDVKKGDFFNPYLSMLKAGFGSLAYQGVWSIYDQELVNSNLALAPDGGFKIQPIVQNKYYGRIFKKPFMTQQKGQYKGTPFRTFSGGAFVGGYSDHYPTYIVISK